MAELENKMLVYTCPDCGNSSTTFDELPCGYACIESKPKESAPYKTLSNKYDALVVHKHRQEKIWAETIGKLHRERAELKDENLILTCSNGSMMSSLRHARGLMAKARRSIDEILPETQLL